MRPAPATTRKRAPVVPLTTAQQMAFALNRLASPPARPFIERAPPAGSVLWRWVMPLALCLPINRLSEIKQPWRLANLKADALEKMLGQHHFQRRKAPLPGRPMVRAIRFSSVESDRDNSWTKVPIDRLTSKHGGLNFIVDDKPRCLDLRVWWEPAPPGKGFGYFEVWSGV